MSGWSLATVLAFVRVGEWSAGVPLGLALAGVCAWLAWSRFGARIYARERSFEMRFPFALGGRPDLIMQEWGGLLVVHDLKTRSTDRVYDSDRLQLELYALMVRRATGRKVASWAVSRVSVGGNSRSRRVELRATEEELTSLAERYAALSAAPLAARMTARPWLCERCGFRGKECPGKAGARGQAKR
jgi:CRISPR-associated exonuclease Cas4